MNTATSPVIERVKKLLALSNSDNANERDAALAKANALIAEHNIDLVLVQGNAEAKEAFTEETALEFTRQPVETKFIAWLLQAHFNVKILYGHGYKPGGPTAVDGVWRSGRSVRTFCIIGRKSEAAFATWLVGYLGEEFKRRWAYYKNAHSVPAGERNTFLYGVYQGLSAKLKEEQELVESARISEIASQQQQSVLPADGTAGQVTQLQAEGKLQAKYSLAVQGEKESLESELNRRYPRLGRARSSNLNIRHGSGSLAAGQATGRTISLNRPLNR